LPGLATVSDANAMAEQCLTVYEFISFSLRKEILHIWLHQEPAPLNVDLVGALVGTWSRSIAEELVRLVKGWIPGLLLSADSPLSDLGGDGSEQSMSSLPASYVAESARLTVSESLHAFFGSLHFSGEAPPGSPFALRPELRHQLPSWLLSEDFRLPIDSVFCLSAEIGPVLLRAPRDESLLDEDGYGYLGADEDMGIEIGPLIGSPRGEVPRPPAGSREELLAKRLQNYQRRIFLLERELMVRSRSEKEKVAFEKAERAKAEARLMEINCQLEERLKARTEDLRKTGQKLVEAQRGMNHTKWLLEDKNKQITKFEYKEENHQKVQEEFQEREKNLSKRLLRLAIQEDTMRQREEFRIDKLRAWMTGEAHTDSLSEVNADINMKAALERLEDDFELTFKKRQEKFEAALREYDRRLDEKRSQYNALNKQVAELELGSRKKANAGQDFGEQITSMILEMDTRELEGLFQSEPQLWSKVNQAMGV